MQKLKFSKKEKKINKKVAIVGSGPAGLAAAYFLKKEGLDITIFEKFEKNFYKSLTSNSQYPCPFAWHLISLTCTFLFSMCSKHPAITPASKKQIGFSIPDNPEQAAHS